MKYFYIVFMALALFGCTDYFGVASGTVVGKKETAVVGGDRKLYRVCEIMIKRASGCTSNGIQVPDKFFDELKIGDVVNEYDLSKVQPEKITPEAVK